MQHNSDEWDNHKIDQQLTDSAIKHWHKHLTAYVPARDGTPSRLRVNSSL